MRAFQTCPPAHRRHGGGLRARQTATACVAMISALWGGIAQAEDLMDLYQAAKAYDAAYLSAKSQADSVRYQVEQAYALHRPNVGLQADWNRYKLDSSQPVTEQERLIAASTGYPLESNDVSATNRRLALQAKMPLYNATNDAKVSQAELQLQLTDADLKIAEDDLTFRLAKAYFDVLSAQEVLKTAQANKKALSEQLAAAKRSFEVGNATITDTREAQARYDLADAQEIAAINDLQVKHIALDQLVGKPNVEPAPLLATAKLDSLSAGGMEDWVNQSADSPAIRKANVGMTIAKLELDKAKAGNLPTVDAIGSATKAWVQSSNSSYKTSAGAGMTYTAGVQANVPLYLGGAIDNRIKEVVKLQEKAENDRDNALRSVALGTRQAYMAVQSGIAQVKALEAAEGSAKLALEATQLGYRVGVRINKDVLDAQTLLANTQKDLAKARYDVIVGSVKLKQAAGVLKTDDLDELNHMLAR